MSYTYKLILLIFLFVFFIVPVSCLANNFTGMWWDESKPGTGVFLGFTEGSNGVCGSWYLYDERGAPQWLTFIGTVENNKLQATLYSFTGPAFGQPWDNTQVRGEAVGNIDLDFSNSDFIAMNYEVQRQTGSLHLTRFSSKSCAGSLWWDISKQGQGIAHFHFPGPSGQELPSLVWYVYDSNGNSIWYTATSNSDTSTYDVWKFSGPPLGENWDPELVKSEKVGTINVDFEQAFIQDMGKPVDSINIDMRFSVDGINGNLSLRPFVCPVAVPER